MEKAFYTTSARAIKNMPGGYARLYFGAEFCQWRMPTKAAVRDAYARASGMGLGFTLVTPWVTDAGMKKLTGVFDSLAGDAGAGPAEVVVNDYGVLTLLREEFRGLAPVMGRMLARQKRCPRVPGIIEALPEAGRDAYMHAGIEDPLTAKFLKLLGVKRVELDNPLQGVSADLKAARLKGSIYTPYAFVTTTRHCPASFDGANWQSFTGCRKKACTGNVISLSNPAHEAVILMRGNTQFVENAGLPEGLSRMGIDRIVYMDEVP